MNLNLWFPIPIWTTKLPIDLDKTIAKCLELENVTKKVQKSNCGGFQSDFIDWDEHEEFLECKKFIIENLQTIFNETGVSSCTLGKFWININRKEHYNYEHTHPKSLFSGCLYLKIPENSGKIVFLRSDMMTHYVSQEINSPFFYTRCLYEPFPALLLIFPSWLPHHVEANKSDESRISISFNVVESQL